jgi:hypothetical protein
VVAAVLGGPASGIPPAMPAQDEKVSVLGLGLMGSALARALIAKGCEGHCLESLAGAVCGVRGKCPRRQLRPRCVRIEQCDRCLPPELRGGPISLAIVRIESVLPGKVLIQLSTGSPADARGTSAWAQECRVAYLDGAILGSPSTIGGDQAKVLVSGPQEVSDQNVELFKAFTHDPSFCGDEIGRAATLDPAALELSAGCAMVLFHAMVPCAAESISFGDLFDLATPFKDGYVERVTNGITTDDVPSGNASCTHMDGMGGDARSRRERCRGQCLSTPGAPREP